ncbi:Shedu anti-phage system protein SduA domain-containing protein [Idiomarina loihiensis]|uniref:Shedu immune nuclease family protein n=1 Tax=Idiomarina loihiensis TaxID=135577 RepID=UPI0038506BA9
MSAIKRNIISIKAKKLLAAESGYKCSFPECEQNLYAEGKTFLGEVAFIESITPGGPRYSPELRMAERLEPENCILLCPNHHKLIDAQPERYPAQWLKDAKSKHLNKIKNLLAYEEIEPPDLDEVIEISLKEAISIWDDNQLNPSEEFWQKLFQKCPAVLSQIFPQSMMQIGSKCYLGGKSLMNTGGSVVDFIYTNKSTTNIVIVEIKTPKTQLLGKRYRNGAYTMSADLSGSIVQALNYKDKILKEYYKLKDETSEVDFLAFSPKCIVVIGSIQEEMANPEMSKSFELFRGSLTDIDIVTYDELFQKSIDVLAICS